jgi:hypothetical protein
MALSSSVSALTRDKFIPVLVDNIYKSNVLCLKLLANAEKLDGGASIVIPVEYAKFPSSGGSQSTGWIDYASGTTAVNEVETYQKASYNWATGYAGVKIPGEEEMVNKGSSQVISLLKAKLKSAEKSMKDLFGYGMFAAAATTNGLTTLNGVGTSNTGFNGSAFDIDGTDGPAGLLETGLPATTAVILAQGGVPNSIVGYNRALGGITAGNTAAGTGWWAGKLGSFELISFKRNYTNDTGAFSWSDAISLNSSNVAHLTVAMTRMYGALTVDNDQPDLIVTTQAIYDAYETSLQANKRFAGDDAIANAGFDSLRFKGATVVVDSHCPPGQMYFLNTNYIDFKVHKDRNFQFEDFKRLETADNIQSRLFWMGQLTCSNPGMQGVLYNGPVDYS